MTGLTSLSPLASELEQELKRMPYVDTHSHVPSPDDVKKSLGQSGRYDVVRLLGATTYVAEFIYGETWQEIQQQLKVNAHHAYLRPILEALRDLYGLGPEEELNDSNVEQISSRMDQAHRDPGWYEKVLERANIAHVIWLQNQPRRQSDMPSRRVHPMWNTDAFIFITGREKKDGPWSVDAVHSSFQAKVRNIADHEELMFQEIKKFFSGGGVGLKSTAAYFRSLDFQDDVPAQKAGQLFTRVLDHQELKPPDRKALEDYLMTRLLSMVAELQRPIQFHTGNQQNWNVVGNSNPLGLNNLLFSGRYYGAKFVFLHGGYPYTQESIMLVRYYGNAYLDLAWMALFSPAAAKRSLHDAIDMIDGRRITFGTDCANLEEQYGTAKYTRRILAEVLAEKISSRYLTKPVALAIGERILSTNAMELYELK
ncbi:MAG TPA: amidohydrolase family protein [Polyangiaceae bacterium]|jgi:predicted TIM-barrel fold metal-dependent hydrolase